MAGSFLCQELLVMACHVCHCRDRLRLQKKFQKQFGVRQKWDQKSQVN